jgi:predicted DNA-binding antitoxin AbrB/MazE fold protein
MPVATFNNRGKKIMAGTIRARVGRGILKLLGKIDIPEGKEVSVTIIDTSPKDDRDAFNRSAGSWKGTIDADALIENIYSDRARASDRPVPRL